MVQAAPLESGAETSSNFRPAQRDDTGGVSFAARHPSRATVGLDCE